MASLLSRLRLRFRPRALPALFCIATLAATTGCQTIHYVKVDAINDPGKSLGTAYRLEMHDPTGSQAEEVAADARTLVKEALAARGMYEAPPNGAADMIITAEYGVGPGQMKIVYKPAESTLGIGATTMGRGTPKPILVFEKYIKLTAREPSAGEQPTAPRSVRRGDRGEELWSLTVSVEDEKKDLAPYLTVLASTSVDYIGSNSGSELHVPVDAATAGGDLRRRSTAAPSR